MCHFVFKKKLIQILSLLYFKSTFFFDPNFHSTPPLQQFLFPPPPIPPSPPMDEPQPQHAGASQPTRLPALLRTPASHNPPKASQNEAQWSKNKGKLHTLSSHAKASPNDVVFRKKGGSWVVQEKKASGHDPNDAGRRGERIPRQIKAFDMRLYGPQGVDDAQGSLLGKWLNNHHHERLAYSSIATWAEVTLQRVVADTAHLQKPNPLRTAVSCMLLDSVTSLFGRYEGLMQRLKEEIFSSIYHEWPGSGELREESLPSLLPLPSAPVPKTLQRKDSINSVDGYTSTKLPACESSGLPKVDLGALQRTALENAREAEVGEEEEDAVETPSAQSVASASSFSSHSTKARKATPQGPQRATTPPHQKLNLYELNQKSTYYQVCRQLIFSQDNALTVDQSKGISITDVLNAAIRRWQLGIVKIYFANWRMINKSEHQKKKKVLQIAERLFAKKQSHMYKTCFLSWRSLVRAKLSKTKTTTQEARANVININMGKKLLRLESGWKNLQEQADFYQKQYEQSKATLVKLSGILQKYKDERAEADEGSASQPQTRQNTPTTDTDAAPQAQPTDNESTHDATPDAPELPSTPEPPEKEEVKEVLDEIDLKITEALNRTRLEIERKLEVLGTGKDPEPARNKHPPPPPPKEEKKAPYQEVLRWVNFKVHSLAGPSRKITNFVTDLASTHNYAYLLRALGVVFTPKGNLVRFCLDPNNDDTIKAELIIEECEKLVGPLKPPLKPNDILKAKASRNAAMIFKLYRHFGDAAPIVEKMGSADMPFDDPTPDGSPRGSDAGSDTAPDGADVADGSDSEEGDLATNGDYDRWMKEYPDEAAHTNDDANSQSSCPSDDDDKTEARRSQPKVTLREVLETSPVETTTSGAGMQAFNTLKLSGFGEKDKDKGIADIADAVRSPTTKDGQHMLITWVNAVLQAAGSGGPPVDNFTTQWRDLSLFVRLLKSCSVVVCKGAMTPTRRPLGRKRNILADYFIESEKLSRLLSKGNEKGQKTAKPDSDDGTAKASSPAAHRALFEDRRAFLMTVLMSLGVAPPAVARLYSDSTQFFVDFVEEGATPPSSPPQKPDKGKKKGVFKYEDIIRNLKLERQENVVLLSQLYSLLNTETSGVVASPGQTNLFEFLARDQVVVSVSEEMVAQVGYNGAHSAKQRGDLAASIEVLNRNALVLQRILLAYCNRDAYDTQLSKEDFAAFCEYCKLDAEDGRFPATGRHPLSEAVLALIRIAALEARCAGRGVSEVLQKVIETQIVGRGQPSQLAAFLAGLELPVNAAAMMCEAEAVRPLFLARATHAAGALAEPLVTYHGFLSFLSDASLLCCNTNACSLTSKEAAVVYASCQGRTEGLCYNDFMKALCCAAAMKIPATFHSLEFQIRRFLQGVY